MEFHQVGGRERQPHKGMGESLKDRGRDKAGQKQVGGAGGLAGRKRSGRMG